MRVYRKHSPRGDLTTAQRVHWVSKLEAQTEVGCVLALPTLRKANRDVLYANVKEDSTTRTQAERVREGVVSLLRSGEQGTEPSLWSDNSVFTLPVRHFLTGSTKDSDWLSW